MDGLGSNIHNLPIVDIIDGVRFARTDYVNCLICHQIRIPRVIETKFGMKAMVAECPDCRIAFQTPRPSPEASLAYMNWRWGASDSYVSDSEAQLRRARVQLDHVKSFRREPGRLLDFGAGAGSFVRVALDNGWDATGLETSSTARARARDSYGVELLRAIDRELRYDVVTLWDVIEHLRDPKAVLAEIGTHLNPGGLVFIETGNYENWRRVADGDRWGLYLFDHQYYFTPSSLRAVLTAADYRGFFLLDVNRSMPTVRPRKILKRPGVVLRAWREWAIARKTWPCHGDINVMIVACRKEPDLNGQ